jgi:spore coat protein I
MLDMEREIAENYGLDVRNLFPYKNILVAATPYGRKALKRLPFSPERILFVHGAKEHLAGNDFERVDRYICTLSGEPYFIYSGSCYCLTDYIEGRESNFDNDNDVRLAARVLAQLHKASKGYVAPSGCKVQDELGRLPLYFVKRLDDIKKMRRQAKKGKGKFDELFLQYADYFVETAEDAIDELASSHYMELVEKTRDEGLFCHHDFTQHNIIMAGERATVTGFDYCCFELRVYDLANLIRRKMRKCDWDVSRSELIVNSYNSVEPINEDELCVMKIILRFPQKFWRVVNRYYNSRRSWSERSSVIRLQEVIDEVGPFEEFLRQCDTLL